MEYYVQIGQKQVDLAGKHRVWSVITNGDWFMTKWDYDPSDAEVEAETNRMLAIIEAPPPSPPEE